jgi:hypothetical protein
MPFVFPALRGEDEGNRVADERQMHAADLLG